MRRTSHRLSRSTRSPELSISSDAGVSLVDALVALVILVLALSVVATPIVAATLRTRNLAAETSEMFNARQEALE